MSRVSKLHETIVTSSIWNEDDTTRIVWVTMLAIRDRKGFVGASAGGLAHAARVSVPACQAAIAKFLGPDPDSRTKTDEGRRIREVDGGWILLNHEKHSLAKDEEGDAERKTEKSRERVKRFREKKAKAPYVTLPALPSVTVTPCNAPSVTSHRETADQPALFSLEPPPAPPELSADEKARAKRFPTTEAAKRISALFRRRLTTAWHPDEVKAFKAIGVIDPADLDLIEAYYAAERAKGDDQKTGGHHRRDLPTFLNNFAGELDRARLSAPKGKIPSHEDPPNWREFLASIKRDYAEYRFAPGFLRSDFGKWRPSKL